MFSNKQHATRNNRFLLTPLTPQCCAHWPDDFADADEELVCWLATGVFGPCFGVRCCRQRIPNYSRIRLYSKAMDRWARGGSESRIRYRSSVVIEAIALKDGAIRVLEMMSPHLHESTRLETRLPIPNAPAPMAGQV